jgi:2-polyprenyl-3-methyl-5-hydroxy-6-metoxy-1,4-benzoquinol methylase
MEKDLFEAGADIDVEALIDRIRESIENRTIAFGVADPQESEQITLRLLQLNRLIHELNAAGLHAGAINQTPIKRRGKLGAIEFRLKRLLKWLVHWNTKSQADFNVSVTRSLGLIADNLQVAQHNFSTAEDLLRNGQKETAHVYLETNRWMNGVTEKIDDCVNNNESLAVRLSSLEGHTNQELQSIREMLHALEARYEQSNENLGTEIIRFSRTLNQTIRDTETIAARASALEQKVDHGLEDVTAKIVSMERSNMPSNGGFGDQPFDYVLFERLYRGPAAEIKRRQSTYIDLFRDKENVIDLGCGQGEFVELLAANGINVTGVDRNEEMVNYCRGRSLPVVQADIFDYLMELSDGSCDGIFLSQVVEHLPFELILKLVNLCAQKLVQGGLIVAETVNTSCLAALSNFYLDPTHVRPVPPELLRFVFERASLQVQCLKFSSPLPGNDVSEVLDLETGLSSEATLYQDYAVVALRP